MGGLVSNEDPTRRIFFFIREIRFNETLSVNQTSALFIETRQMKKVQKNKSR